MKEYRIAQDAAGQRLDRYLTKRFPNAGKAFLQKMLRKKNILLNNQRSEPNIILKENDTLQVYFSDETIAKFSGIEKTHSLIPPEYAAVFEQPLYSDQNILVLNKPAGLLSQPAGKSDPALSDFLNLIIDNHSDTFHLAPANRLDRNTSGIVLIPKNYTFQKQILSAIRERKIIKEYIALVSGKVNDAITLENHLTKTENNFMQIEENDHGIIAKLDLFPFAAHQNTTLLKIRLHTGRTHQIRAQLSRIDHPVIGDPKYGSRSVNQLYQKKYHLTFQLLHSYHYAVPEFHYDFTAPLPDYFKNILTDLSYTEEEINGILA